MDQGEYRFYGNYHFEDSSRGFQSGTIEILENSMVIGEATDSDSHQKIKERGILGIYRKEDNGLYILKTNLKRQGLATVAWRFRPVNEETMFFPGSWLKIPELVYLSDVFDPLFETEGDALGGIRREATFSDFERFFIHPEIGVEFNMAEDCGMTGSVQFLRK